MLESAVPADKKPWQITNSFAAFWTADWSEEMNVADIVVIVIIGIALLGVGYYYYKRSKSGKGGCGCGCSGCSSKGNCNSTK